MFYVFEKSSDSVKLAAEFDSMHCGKFCGWSRDQPPDKEHRFIAGPKGQVPKVSWGQMLPIARARQMKRKR